MNLNNVLLITDDKNYESFEGVVKTSLENFFGMICTSIESAYAWMTMNAKNFDLIITVVKKDEIEKYGKKPRVIERIANRNGIKSKWIDQEEIGPDELRKIIKENLIML